GTWGLYATDGSRQGVRLRGDAGSDTGWPEGATEYMLLEATAAAGVPVPRVRVLLGPDDALGQGFVMDRVEGETIPRRILRDDAYASARPLLAAQCGEIAARIHATDMATLPDLPVHRAACSGAPVKCAAGFGDVRPLRDAYERVRFRRIDQDTLRWWVALGTLKWGVICIAQAFTHLTGVLRSVELATLGRRVAEMEWDL